MLGMILNSMPIASLRGILNSSRSLDVPGGLKLNCWRTISRHSALPEAHHEMVNSCVRAESFSSNKTIILEMLWGESKVIRIACGPSAPARQPLPPSFSALSIGWAGSSEVISKRAKLPTSSHLPCRAVGSSRICFRIMLQWVVEVVAACRFVHAFLVTRKRARLAMGCSPQSTNQSLTGGDQDSVLAFSDGSVRHF